MLIYKQLDFVCQFKYQDFYQKNLPQDSKLRKILGNAKINLAKTYSVEINSYHIIYTEFQQYLNRWQHSFDKKYIFGQNGIDGIAKQLLEAYINNNIAGELAKIRANIITARQKNGKTDDSNSGMLETLANIERQLSSHALKKSN